MSSDAAFTKAEPVVAAGLTTTGGVALATAIMEVSSAFEWHTFTDSQSKAVLGLTAVVLALAGAFIARRQVSPTSTVAALIAAAEAPVIVTNVLPTGPAPGGEDAAQAPLAEYPAPVEEVEPEAEK